MGSSLTSGCSGSASCTYVSGSSSVVSAAAAGCSGSVCGTYDSGSSTMGSAVTAGCSGSACSASSVFCSSGIVTSSLTGSVISAAERISSAVGSGTRITSSSICGIGVPHLVQKRIPSNTRFPHSGQYLYVSMLTPIPIFRRDPQAHPIRRYHPNQIVPKGHPY